MQRRRHKAIPVFIYQMGKVASSSIHHSLKKQYPGAVAHAHHIGPQNWAAELFYRWYREGDTIRIISPVRDPISRNISSFFQKYSDYSEKEFARLNLQTDNLIHQFLEEYPHDTPLNWFDAHIKKHFDIDIYESAFDTTNGTVYRKENAQLLVFRIDMPDTRKETAIRSFLEFPGFRLINSNVSQNKLYYPLYKQFIASLTLPDDYLEKMASSRYFNYFYSPEEIETILSRWRGR